jgi:hypothetical protein
MASSTAARLADTTAVPVLRSLTSRLSPLWVVAVVAAAIAVGLDLLAFAQFFGTCLETDTASESVQDYCGGGGGGWTWFFPLVGLWLVLMGAGAAYAYRRAVPLLVCGSVAACLAAISIISLWIAGGDRVLS